MYIVSKKINEKDYFYIRQSVRTKEGKINSKSIAYGGKTREDAEKKLLKLKNSSVENNKKSSFEEKVMDEKKDISIEELASFCKAKGFVFPSSVIYGGLAGFWDFGPLGVELFNNIKRDWWNFFVRQRDNIVGMEGSIISHPRTWKASGHITNFNINDYLVVCKKCGKSVKVDKPNLEKIKCDNCGGEYDWENAKMIEQMFKTKVGTDQAEVYLRGETAQGMFLDFKLIQQTSRMQLPFGIAQLGRCFRNEIAPRDFLFRSREFHIGEFEFFIHPEEKKCNLLKDEHLDVKFMFLDEETQKSGKDELKEVSMKELIKKNKLEEWHAYWLAEQIKWFYSLGLKEIKIREHTKDELSHYSSATFDIDYMYPFGSLEVAANANRGQYDLKQHEKESKEEMAIFDESTKTKIIPRVIEPTFGMERVFLAILTKAYTYDNSRENTVLKIPAKLAPIKAAVFPVIRNNEELVRVSREVYNNLKQELNVIYDSGGSIGRRYARQDCIGTPFTITIDEQSLNDKTVTLRDRDSTNQFRVKIKDLNETINRAIKGEDLSKLGKKVNTRIK